MKLRDIKAGTYYETTQGMGKCLDTAKRHPMAVKFQLVFPMRRLAFLLTKEVLAVREDMNDADFGGAT